MFRLVEDNRDWEEDYLYPTSSDMAEYNRATSLKESDKRSFDEVRVSNEENNLIRYTATYSGEPLFVVESDETVTENIIYDEEMNIDVRFVTFSGNEIGTYHPSLKLNIESV